MQRATGDKVAVLNEVQTTRQSLLSKKAAISASIDLSRQTLLKAFQVGHDNLDAHLKSLVEPKLAALNVQEVPLAHAVKELTTGISDLSLAVAGQRFDRGFAVWSAMRNAPSLLDSTNKAMSA
jgi:hypothetical protein